MIPGIPQPRALRWLWRAYVAAFFVYLALPLVVVCVFAFNKSQFAALPWNGFTLDWFIGDQRPWLGVFNDRGILEALKISAIVAFWVSAASVSVGVTTAFLFVRHDFRFKQTLYVLMLLPLVIPGIILGISILVETSYLANWLEDATGLWFDGLRPGLTLVVLGQFAFIATFATLVISARLEKFDRSLEEAALNLGATPLGAVRQVTLPYLAPAIVGAALVSMLMSFENFNTTLMLVGSDAPLTIEMFDRMKQGSTPVLNAVSLLLIVASSVLGGVALALRRAR
ncbi:ABC transporter permease [Oceanicella actignis]|uniref:Spermidine/putrescine transport system permease protein n=1 Tax=Oceanicella actignis TaxID=1189325 RepID=A0A1M7TB97_9RHOB|nr:ABC transporter permease [Oceanicella actignis]SET53344.1 spermidine/putrescine transport system permease protein [Oceanicella actignis]SHN68019.1 spermidine/putrescine transport system permease protein [Oceanicella actignis]